MTPGDRPDNPTDDARDDDMDGLENTWRDLPADEPPASLDIAVLRKAREELEQTERRAWPWTHRWTRQLATVSVAVVAVTLLLQLREETPQAPLPAPAPMPERASETADSSVAADAVMNDLEESASAKRQAQPAAEEFSTPKAEARQAPRALASDAGDIRERQEQLFSDDADSLDNAQAPAEWLEQIMTLKDDGNPSWRDELARFQAAWPDYPLPPALEQAIQ